MEKPVLVILVYKNRRLYDPSKIRYIKYEDVYDLLQEGVRFTIQDLATGADRTRKIIIDVLVQRELNRKAGEPPLLSVGCLLELIRAGNCELAPLATKFLQHTAQTLLQYGTAKAQSGDSAAGK